ncbi:hypothetical protein Taro_002570 [Colocasia esculenta]|uniref:Uncharacterized protein n=1 Tax=Colocasia esculenta TaxID=4460 RepID=A0A843TD33_COLES|nr:hypothetical protein [Colocasia esculenta]
MWPDATTSSAIPPVSEVTGVVRTESTTSLRMEAIMEVGRLSATPSTASSTGPSGDCETIWTRGDPTSSTAASANPAGREGTAGSISILCSTAAWTAASCSAAGGKSGTSWNQNLTHYEVKEAVERIQLQIVTASKSLQVLKKSLR